MTQRAERIRPYPQATYLASREQHLGQGKSQGFCQVLEWRVAGPQGRTIRGQAWKAFPWVTMVIGSGCLEVPAASAGIGHSLAAAVIAELAQPPSKWDVQPYEDLVNQFTWSLVQDRLMSGLRQETEPAAAGDLRSVKVEAAMITLATALLTRVYHLVSASYPKAMSRWEEDVAEVDLDRASTATAEIDDLIGITADVVQTVQIRLDAQRAAAKDRSTRQILGAVCQLLNDIDSDLSTTGRVRQVPAQRLRLLTEVAWYFLIRGTPIYPGWTEMLLRLMLAQQAAENQRRPRRPRPRYSSLQQLADEARSVLEEPTKNSWDASLSGAKDELSRQRLYQAAASVLWAQAEAHSSPIEGSADLPPAAAFLTTLDLELEMALVATEPDRSFSVAVPVYVVADLDADVAEFCWLVADVPPAPQDGLGELDRLRRPRNWRLLDQRSFQNEPRDQPLVIHLSGCPLIELPQPADMPAKLQSDLRKTGIDVSEDSVLLHAIMVDEYLAMRQSEIELAMLNRGNEADPKSRPSRGLPEALTKTRSKAGTVRYWLVMGVPMADPAVRTRVLAQVTAVHRKEEESRADPNASRSEGLLGRLGAPPPEPGDGDAAAGASGAPVEDAGDLAGAAITLHIDDDDVAVLQWLGLDVVEASCHDYDEDLLHYALHVRMNDAQGRRRPPLNESCQLKEPRR